MFPGHSRDFHARYFRRFLLQRLRIFRSGFYVDHHALISVEFVDGGEGFVLAGFMGEVGFGVGGCDDGEGAAEGGLDFAVEMVSGGLLMNGRKGGEIDIRFRKFKMRFNGEMEQLLILSKGKEGCPRFNSRVYLDLGANL